MGRRLIYQLAYVFLIPLYYFLLMLLLRPEGMVKILGGEAFSAGIAAISGLMALSLAVTRTLLLFAADRFSGLRAGISLWPAGEIVIISLVSTLYLGLEFRNSLFLLLDITVVLVLPYCLLECLSWLYRLCRKNKELLETEKIRFYDKNGRLRIVLRSEDVVYIQADNNDVRINYIDNGISCQLVIRNSIHAVDELCMYHGFLRVHRSYLVNPKHVTWLGRGDKDEVYAILDIPDMPRIPVTKRYYSRIEEKVLIQNRP